VTFDDYIEGFIEDFFVDLVNSG